jgi:hypothetical protein
MSDVSTSILLDQKLEFSGLISTNSLDLSPEIDYYCLTHDARRRKKSG